MSGISNCSFSWEEAARCILQDPLLTSDSPLCSVGMKFCLLNKKTSLSLYQVFALGFVEGQLVFFCVW